MGVSLGITEAKNLMYHIQKYHNYDFSDYALTSFRRRIEKIMEAKDIRSFETIQQKIMSDDLFFENLLHDLFAESTEMFRDPSLWRLLRDKYFREWSELNGQIKIWIPVNVSGEELYSLAIMLHEAGMINRVKIYATFFSNRSLEVIKSGIFKLHKIEISTENYKRLQGTNEFSKYFRISGEVGYRDPSLLSNIIFIKQNITFDNSPDEINVIMFRNQMIYYNQTLQEKILSVFNNSLAQNGYLIIGSHEKIGGAEGTGSYYLVDENERIYRKK